VYTCSYLGIQNENPALGPAMKRPGRDLRQHVCYPEVQFQTQAEAYRIFDMRDPQVFYDKEDVWEMLAGCTASRANRSLCRLPM